MDSKKNGIYYTPPNLAEYLARPLIGSSNLSVLDPSYGEGSLLLAAERVFKKKRTPHNIQLFGCDTKPVNGLLQHLPQANLQEVDFFEYNAASKFSTILMNPPYVRHHIQDIVTIKKYRVSFPELSVLNNSADLWAYFMMKSVSHLEKGGNIGAILPWAFLQADYAGPLRKWIHEIFGEIKVLALSHKYFEYADERVVLVWLKNYGQKCKSIQISSAKDIKENITFYDLPLSNWLSDRVMYNQEFDIESILATYKKKFGFTEFEKFADVKIGVVTGADKYFIISKERAKELGFKKQHLLPIVKSSKDFPFLMTDGPKNLKTLISLNKKNYSQYENYIQEGLKHEYNLRVHSKLRDPWYSVKIGKVPDAFFHYRATKIPYLISNEFKVQSTNSIHRIYFKTLSELEIKWLQVSLLSIPGQLSLEASSKTYGRGILKIEPKSLKRALVVKRRDKTIDTIYPQIIKLLSEDKKVEAMNLATTFINRKLKIPYLLAMKAEKALLGLQALRLSNQAH